MAQLLTPHKYFQEFADAPLFVDITYHTAHQEFGDWRCTYGISKRVVVSTLAIRSAICQSRISESENFIINQHQILPFTLLIH